MTDDDKRHLPKIDPGDFKMSPQYQQQHRMMLDQLELIAMPFAPHFDPGKLGLLADAMLSEQVMLTRTVIPAMASPAPGQSDIGIHVWLQRTLHVAGGQDPQVQVAEFEAAKRLDGITDPDEALAAVLAFAFVHLPVARALLRMHGYTYRFAAPADEGAPLGTEDDSPDEDPNDAFEDEDSDGTDEGGEVDDDDDDGEDDSGL